jgi:hypothetical protein
MNVIKVKFRKDETEETLRPDFEDSMIDLAENLAICMAEMRKWEGLKLAAASALSEGMTLLDIAELQTENHVFKISNGELEVDFYKGSVH